MSDDTERNARAFVAAEAAAVRRELRRIVDRAGGIAEVGTKFHLFNADAFLRLAEAFADVQSALDPFESLTPPRAGG